MNPETTRHPNWIEVKPTEGSIRKGDRYRQEFDDGSSREGISAHDWTDADFDIPKAAVFVWPRPEPKPYEAIPEGFENAAVMRVTVGQESSVASFFREDGWVRRAHFGGESGVVAREISITSVAPVAVVPDNALDELREAFARWEDGDVGMDTIEWGKVVSDFLDAIDEADQ